MTTHNNKSAPRSTLTPLTRQELINEVQRQIIPIEKEFEQVFTFINNYPKSVTFFGSSYFSKENKSGVFPSEIAS